jgi:hypothetical protein
MTMYVNAQGHIVMSNGSTTIPQTTAYYIGDSQRFITFAFMVLPDGRVAVHSVLHDGQEPKEDFLYEVAAQQDAMWTAETMVDDAVDYLESLGVMLDNNGSVGDFLGRLHVELKHRLH